jgi:hypothetical protein
MSFMSHMRKESIRKGFEKANKVYGNDRYKGYDPDKVKTNFDELKEIRNKRKNKTWEIIKALFLCFALILAVYLMINMLFGIMSI